MTSAPLNYPRSYGMAQPTETPLERIAVAVEQLVQLQSAPPPDIAAWLARIDPEELNKAVLRRGSMAVPPMESALAVLIDWARGVGS